MDKDKWNQILLLGAATLGFIGLLHYRKSQNARKAIRRTTSQVRQIEKLEKILNEQKAIEHDIQRGVRAPKMLPPPEGKVFLNPLLGTGVKQDINSGRAFLPESVFNKVGGYLVADNVFSIDPASAGGSILLVKGSPRMEIVMNPKNVKAAIVTCGGLCPGLNVVIREIVMSLHFNYDTTEIYGIWNGYSGFYTEGFIKKLTPHDVVDIHTLGGTILKTSRGGWNLEKIADCIEERGFNQIYVIGGDGTHRGINALVEEMERRNLPVFIAGIPKTIDNDIPIIDKSFGFDTSVEEAQRAIDSANIEANSAEYGVGLVKLMGRNSGFIAMQASIANRNVNVCLIPESEYELSGPNGVYNYILERLKVKKHAVVVVAEGAAVSCKDEKLVMPGTDASGNPILYDIGKHLRDGIVKYCKEHGMNITLKYIDPTYMIRTVPANSGDKVLCATLAQAAVHGTFAGFTGFSVGCVAGTPCFIPIDLMISTREGKNSLPGQRRVDLEGNYMWWRLMASTGQPSFINEVKELN
ncbi:unnamed protein product [Blepharisma stoltei]|uniref:Phosphofructokinase domain-containing protein n=1 Tax=Blepharisma stoltei TaxID=1481888 RepID=A0AAU9JSK5_9CILI|nr:unnamed protein product [Blepharisma stoltei]